MKHQKHPATRTKPQKRNTETEITAHPHHPVLAHLQVAKPPRDFLKTKI